MIRVPVSVLGPSLMRRALARLISALDDYRLVPDLGQVVVIAGSGWANHLEDLAASRDRVSTVVVTHGEDDVFTVAGRCGVEVFLGWDDGDCLEDALRAAVRREAYCSPTVFRKFVQSAYQREHHQRSDGNGKHFHHEEARLASLSGRELEVVLLVADGLSNKEVGYRLHLSEATVKGHLSRIYAKLGVDRRSDLTMFESQLRSLAAVRSSENPPSVV